MLVKDRILNKIPGTPGIYLMKDKNNQILYIGKAKILKSRVRSYFQKSDSLLPRTRIMMKRVTDIDFITTSSEIEALILESNFIKKHQPRYNVLLKDDKHYPYIRLATDTDFPYLSIVRKVKKDGARYFGPYVMVKEVRETIRLIHKIFPFRESRDVLDGSFKRRPCLNFQMRRCTAPCAGKISKEYYNKIVQDVILFLKGRNDALVKYLSERMQKASDEFRFEDAAKLRDQIESVESVIKNQKIISTNMENQDVIVFYREGNNANVQILMIRNGKMSGNKSYKLAKLDGIDNDELISSFIKQYYADEPLLPQEILLSMDIEEKEIIAQWLSAKKKNKVLIQVPEKGRKKNLVKMAEENARFAFRKEEHGRTILEELKELLELRNMPKRIEAFDISNISGSMAVGASVLFVNGEPFKKGYRHFKIREIKGADDYSMTSQIVLRHYARLLDEKKELPHLVIIDGGKGHLTAAAKVLEDLSLLKKIDVIAIAKGRKRNKLETDEIYTLKHKEASYRNHNSVRKAAQRVEAKDDRNQKELPPWRINKKTSPKKKFLQNKDPVAFPVDSPVKFLIQRIRDEAHRFAVAYHRKLRKKGGLHSILDDVAGIGGKRKKQLIKRFGGVTKIKEASVNEIKEVPYITEKIAREIKAKIHP